MKETRDLRERLDAALGGGTKLWADEAAVETGEFNDRALIVVDNKILGLWAAGDMAAVPFLTVRGLLQYRPVARYVTVDMGAVKFVVNGADVMAPGIVEADPALQPGDWCWVRDEKNKQPLAVGQALVPGTAMVRGKGKAVKSLHHLGDKLWLLE
jgi:PUA domain protein